LGQVVSSAVQAWQIVGAGNFATNASPGPDMLLRQMVIGQNVVYEMGGVSNNVFVSTAYLNPVWETDWRLGTQPLEDSTWALETSGLVRIVGNDQ
jgi:hypothetical protein